MGSIGVDWHVMAAQIVNFVLLFVVVGFVVLVLIKLNRNNKTRTPADIARDRYTKGKITLEEFNQIKRELGEE